MIGEFRHEGQTVMVTPMQDFYITPNMGKDEIRIAYVLKSEELKTALEILKKGLEEYLKK
jgi:aspartate aminotransferase